MDKPMDWTALVERAVDAHWAHPAARVFRFSYAAKRAAMRAALAVVLPEIRAEIQRSTSSPAGPPPSR